jgi:hypothetical protein
MARLARFVAILTLAALPLVAWSTPAQAATITASPASVGMGGQVTLSGDVLVNGTPACEVPGVVTLISPAFDGLGDFGGVGAVTADADAGGGFTTTVTLPGTTAPGTYSISGRCGGGDLGVTASLSVTAQTVTIPPTLTG